MGPQSTAWTPNQFLLKSWGHRYYNTKGNIWLIARSAKHPNLPRKWGWIRTLGLIYTLYLCHVWDGWIASPTQWTWVWANSGRQWRTGEPGMWQFMGVQSRTQLRDWTTAIRQITNENLLYSTGNSTQCSVVTFSSVQSLSCVWLFATPWIAAFQASLSITNSWSSPRLTSI